MKIELEVSDLLTPEEIQEKAREILIEHLRYIISKDAERLLSNSSYYCAYQIMDDLITEDQKEKIRNKTIQVIDKMGPSDVFRAENHWREKPSTAYLEIERAVRENKDRIVSKTISVIENFDYESHLSSDCIGFLESTIIKKLQTKE